MALSQLTIVGAGLIGGSIALAAKRAHLAHRICAIDRLQPQIPGNSSPFDEWIDEENQAHLSDCLKVSSLTLLCVPVVSLIEMLPFILSTAGGPVTDCGSTKKAITESVKNHPRRGLFVAGHPMAGRPQGGLKNATADLFSEKKWILCPQGSDAEPLKLVRDFVGSLGATAVDLTVEDHDRSVAVTSHLPQVLASSLAVLAQKKDALKAAGPGFASATRVAGGAEEMWRDIFGTNAQEISSALLEISEILRSLGHDLRSNDMRSSLELLRSARRARIENDD